MDMTVLCDACSDWSTVGLQVDKMSPTNVSDVFVSAGECEQAITRIAYVDSLLSALSRLVELWCCCYLNIVSVYTLDSLNFQICGRRTALTSTTQMSTISEA